MGKIVLQRGYLRPWGIPAASTDEEMALGSTSHMGKLISKPVLRMGYPLRARQMGQVVTKAKVPRFKIALEVNSSPTVDHRASGA